MRNKKFLKAVSILSAIAMCVSSMSALAAWNISGGTDNVLTMSSYKTEIVEDYEVPKHVDPSEEIRKVVNISNTGDVDVIVRAKVEKMFGTTAEDGTFTKDDTLDPEMIEIDFDSEYWTARSDGYYYYKEILKAGETTKKPLFESYRLSEKAGNAYKGKTGHVIVMMDSVQAAGNAVSSWGVTYSELGITEPATPASEDTSVTYIGKEKGFDIETSKTDLFAGFKDLLPGCGRTQNIILKNTSDTEVEILLRAEAAEQGSMSSEQLALVNELLDKYATIVIKNDGQTIYEGPVSGNLNGSGNSMKTDISLGKLAAGKDKTLTVELELDPEMDNKYMSLTGKVHWVFTATGEDPATTSTVTPQTGDTLTPFYASIAVFIMAAGCLAVSRKMLKKGDN